MLVATNSSGASAPSSPPICYVEPVHLDLAADTDLNVIDLRILDESGAGFGVLLSPPCALDLIMGMVSRLSELIGSGEVGRVSEAQVLIETARRLGGRQKWLAEHLCVSNTTVTAWRQGRAAPSQERLEGLRRLVRGLVPND